MRARICFPALVLLSCSSVFGLALAAHAAPIPIVNFSFEDFTLAPGDFSRQEGGYDDGTGILSADAVPGWTTTPLVPTTATGTFRPNPLVQTPTDGVNVAYVAVLDPATGFGALEQTLASVLTADTVYTLEVDLFHVTSVPYKIELRAGGIVLVEDLNSLPGNPPGNPTFATSTLFYQATAGDAGLGAPLVISLQGGLTTGATPLFDNVRLDATVIPEPTTSLLLALGLAGLSLRRSRATGG